MKKKWRKNLTGADVLFAVISAIVFAGLLHLMNHKENPDYKVAGSVLAGVLFALINLAFHYLFGNAFNTPPKQK